jgi:hypothetical protein
MNLFSKKFGYLLEADVDEKQPVPQDDREAMAQQLDTAKPADFDVKTMEREQQVDQHKANQVHVLETWIQQIDQFVEFLNGTTSESVQTQLHAAPCDTKFQDIARSEKKRISRLAADLSTLSENFKGYLISFND